MANAVRDNPERAEFLGYSARWVRYYSFIASGFFAGIAGALFAINFEILTEENLNTTQSGIVLLVTFLGGVRAIVMFFPGGLAGLIMMHVPAWCISGLGRLGLPYLTLWAAGCWDVWAWPL